MTCGYGYFPGGDPRNFHPDEDCCTEKELAAHRAACDAWNRGEHTDCPPSHGCLVDKDGRVCGWWDGGAFGIGSYDYDDDDNCYGTGRVKEGSR